MRWLLYGALVMAFGSLAMLVLLPSEGTTRETMAGFIASEEKVERRKVESVLDRAGGGEVKVSVEKTEEMEKLITQSLGQTEAAFRSLERASASEVGRIEGEKEGKHFTGVYVLIPQPSTEEYAKYSALIGAALERLPATARRAGYDRHVKLLAEYAWFKRPFKLVTRFVRESPDLNGPPTRESLVEHYVPTRDSVKVEGNKVTIEGGGPSRCMMGEKQDRYRYLFESGVRRTPPLCGTFLNEIAKSNRLPPGK